MSEKRMQQIERRIGGIKKALLEIGPMRPGSLTRQYNTTWIRRIPGWLECVGGHFCRVADLLLVI